VIPSLFKEGQNVIMYGKFNNDEGQFKAKELLAKHDENYIPKNYKNTSLK
jgi:cytochrome c-type biogenesis protein CcmE